MPVIIATQGIPASGKTTWSKNWVAEDSENRARVNRDDIRFATFGKFHDTDEKLVSMICNAQIDVLMRHRRDIVVDGTNIHPLDLDRLRRMGLQRGYSFEIKRFDISIEDAVKRDSARERSVGRDVIERMHSNLSRWDSEQSHSSARPLNPIRVPSPLPA